MYAKTNITTFDQVNATAAHAGLLLMTLATALGVVELPHREATATVSQSANVIKAEMPGEMQGSTQRREREESGPHYVSYSAAQRTPGRTGKY